MKSHLLVLLSCMLSLPLTAQSIYLLKDIQEGTGDGFTFADQAGVAYNDQFLFVAEDADHGSELWISDGTPDGTSMVADINPGPAGCDCQNFQVVNGKVLFTAEHPDYGKELWVTDGTAEGTALLKDIFDGAGASMESFANGEDYFYVFDDVLYFSAENSTAGQELWRSDGTAAGTFMVKNISTFTNSFKHSRPSEFEAHQGKLYFAADNQNDGRELYVTDGTAAGTRLVKNINSGSSSSDPSDLLSLGDFLIFKAEGSFFNTELWRSDGTAGGTVLVKEVDPSGSGLSVSANTSEKRFHKVGDWAYFAANDGTTGNELWRTDGTNAGTQLVKDVVSGFRPEGPPQNFASIDSLLFYKYDNGTKGAELWRSNGTVEGTFMAKDIRSGLSSALTLPTFITSHQGAIYFGAEDSNFGTELWQSDGTEEGTIRISDINLGGGDANPGYFHSVGDLLFFAARHPDYGFEWWVLGPTPAFSATYTVVSPVTCFGDATGEIILSLSGGQTPYTITLDDVIQTGDTIRALAAGIYEVSVTDAAGANELFSVEIQQPDELAIEATVSIATTGNNDGKIELIVNGGTPPYQFAWDTGNAADTTAVLDNLPGGEYAVSLTDANGCSKTEAYLVDIMMGTAQLASDVGIRIFPNPSRGSITLKLGQVLSIASPTRIRLLNGLGQEVFRQSIPKGEVEMQLDFPIAMKTGLYFYEIDTETEAVFTGRLMIRNGG